MLFEFRAWPKIARLNRDITITEKLDGTNAAIVVDELGRVGAQSRKRIITPEDDNYGFAAWVEERDEALASILGPGYHFGEWWGHKIQRNYGLKERRFSLFNTKRYGELDLSAVPGLDTVPVLYQGPFSQDAINATLSSLEHGGSFAADFYDPEGIIVYHNAANTMFKVTLKNDEAPKGQV